MSQPAGSVPFRLQRSGEMQNSIPILLENTQRHASAWFRTVATRLVRATASPEELREVLGGSLPERGFGADAAIETLTSAGMRGTVATAGP